MADLSDMFNGQLWQSQAMSLGDVFSRIQPNVVINVGWPDGSLKQPTKDFLYLWWPLVDGPLPDDLWRLRALTNIAVDVLYRGKVVWVHCDAGINRSSLVTGCILSHLGVGQGDDLVRYIRAKRPGALTNQSFADYLAGLPEYDRLLTDLKRQANG